MNVLWNNRRFDGETIYRIDLKIFRCLIFNVLKRINEVTSMKMWLISDTHNRHDKLRIPIGIDAVIHCGDESESGDEWLNEPEARAFFDWYSMLDIPHKLFIPGNHSTAIEKGLVRPQDYTEVQFLVHDQTELDGLIIFGSPYTPKFFNWSFMKDRKDLAEVWASIPKEIDILITHGPPKGCLDVTRDFDSREPIHVGSQSLTRHVTQRIRPILHAFGHIHDERGIRNFGIVRDEATTFVNCSCCNVMGKLVNHGIVLEIDIDTKRILQAAPFGPV